MTYLPIEIFEFSQLDVRAVVITLLRSFTPLKQKRGLLQAAEELLMMLVLMSLFNRWKMKMLVSL